MKIENISVNDTLEQARKVLATEKNIPPSVKVILEVLILIVSLLFERVTKNSSNSSKPPSSDQNRNKNKNKSVLGKNKPGGQNGHQGNTLSLFENPDKIIKLKVNRNLLPKGITYTEVGPPPVNVRK